MFGGLESYLEEAHSVASLLAGLYSSIKKMPGQLLDRFWTRATLPAGGLYVCQSRCGIQETY